MKFFATWRGLRLAQPFRSCRQTRLPIRRANVSLCSGRAGEKNFGFRHAARAADISWTGCWLGSARKRDLINFVAVEVQSIDTTGNYRAERETYLKEKAFLGKSTAGFNWENVNKRILPQLIYKGHVLPAGTVCQKGLFFVCPTPGLSEDQRAAGGGLRPYPIQPGSLTIMWYDIGPEVEPGNQRDLVHGGQFTTTIDQVALAFTAPSNLPPAQVYENAIRASLERK